MRIAIDIPTAEYERLMDAASRERRYPNQQAAYVVLQWLDAQQAKAGEQPHAGQEQHHAGSVD